MLIASMIVTLVCAAISLVTVAVGWAIKAEIMRLRAEVRRCEVLHVALGDLSSAISRIRSRRTDILASLPGPADR
ncbi:MAG: hypothetical protein N2037_06185 [Acidimicrobiales bacterium]|nr:hypothetical protein [Acidimicrobiales bacterium]